MTREEIKNLKNDIKKHRGLMSIIAKEADVKRMILYRALNGKSLNTKLLLMASNLLAEVETEEAKMTKQIRKNQKLVRSLN